MTDATFEGLQRRRRRLASGYTRSVLVDSLLRAADQSLVMALRYADAGTRSYRLITLQADQMRHTIVFSVVDLEKRTLRSLQLSVHHFLLRV